MSGRGRTSPPWIIWLLLGLAGSMLATSIQDVLSLLIYFATVSAIVL